MGPPLAKKQKRLIVRSSNEEEDDDVQCPLTSSRSTHGVLDSPGGKKAPHNVSAPTASPTRAIAISRLPGHTTRTTSARASTPALSPRKLRPPGQKTTAKSGTLYTFFNTITQNQQVNGRSGPTYDPIEIEEEDLIQDVSSSDDYRSLPEKEIDTLSTRSRAQSHYPENLEHPIRNGRPPEASQKFKPLVDRSASSFSRSTTAKLAERRPWAEMFGPASIEELAVHKRKVFDVKIWLENTFKGRERNTLLVLKGPSGTGKTASLVALAKSLEFDVVEWKNPASSDFMTEGFQSLTGQFEDFLERSGKFNSLMLESSAAPKTAKPTTSSSAEDGGRKKVILLEEFPNTFSRTSSALLSFRASVLQYLAANTPPLRTLFARQQDSQADVTPLVMIISETLLTTTTSAADSFTAHRLLGPDILGHQGTTVIEFNPIAPTILTKALELVVQKEARISGRRRTPGPAVLKRLGEVGDIRNAVGSLEFLCIRGDDNSYWGGRVATQGKRYAKNLFSLTTMEQQSIKIITQREASLGIFHAVGKVVYNKREEPSASDLHIIPPIQPPDHLWHRARLKRSMVRVDDLMDETGTDTSTFIAALHENYALSCDGPTSTECLNECLDALSDSDLLGSDRRPGFSLREGFGNQMYGGSGVESLRQNEICFWAAVAGLIFALPYPVKRRIASTAAEGRDASREDSYKMFYPASMRLWKQMEEIEGLIDRWTDPSMHRLSGHSPTPRLVSAGVDMWKTGSLVAKPSSTPLARPEEPSELRSQVGGNLARTETILERLPYLAKLEQLRYPTSSRMRDLAKMTQFHGIRGPTNDLPDEEDNDAAAILAADWATDCPLQDVRDPSSLRRRQTAVDVDNGKQAVSLPSMNETGMERLVLSDDDIEDD